MRNTESSPPLQPVEKHEYDPRQRLAAVCSRAFAGKTAATIDGLRWAAVSEVLGREIKSFKDLTDEEVERLLGYWENAEKPWTPHPQGAQQIRELADEYQRKRGQLSMPLDAA